MKNLEKRFTLFNTSFRISLLASLILMGNNTLFGGETKNSFWLNNLEQAEQLAKEQNKKILMYFSGSDWCLPCMQLKIEVFEQESFKGFADKNFIPVAFDFPAREKNKLSEEQQKYNDTMAETYNAEGAFPLILVLNSDGTVLGKVSGYLKEGPEKYLNKLEMILDKK